MDLDLDLELDSSQYLVNVEDRFNPKCLGMGSKRAALQKRVYLSNGWREIFEKNVYGSQILLANFFTSGVF